MQAVNGADLVLPDGIGVVKGAAMLGTPLKEKTPGIEFAAGLMGKMAETGKSLYLLGAKPGVAEAAAERLQAQYPGLKIAGTHDGYFKEDAPVVEAIRESGADCVFVCLGAPKQELWMAKNGPATGAHVLCGLGGSLDVFAGDVEFIAVSSYQNGTVSSGRVQITHDLQQDITGRELVIVEDILDSGNTLAFLKNYLMAKGAKSISIVTLLDKPARREKAVEADLAGFVVPDEFVVGYGLDYAQLYRNLPYIGVLKPAVYEHA